MLPVLGLAKAPGPADLAAFLAVWGIIALGLLDIVPEYAPKPSGDRPCGLPVDCNSCCSGADGKRPHQTGWRSDGGNCRGPCALYRALARLLMKSTTGKYFRSDLFSLNGRFCFPAHLLYRAGRHFPVSLSLRGSPQGLAGGVFSGNALGRGRIVPCYGAQADYGFLPVARKAK